MGKAEHGGRKIVSRHFQQETCEWSDQPQNPKWPPCGKPRTHFVIDFIHPDPKNPMNEPFPLCDEHWKAYLQAEVEAERDGTWMSDEECLEELRKAGLL
jgi:hypothetical protein